MGGRSSRYLKVEGVGQYLNRISMTDTPVCRNTNKPSVVPSNERLHPIGGMMGVIYFPPTVRVSHIICLATTTFVSLPT